MNLYIVVIKIIKKGWQKKKIIIITIIKKKNSTGHKRQIIGLFCHIAFQFLEILSHTLPSRITSKWQPELGQESAQKKKGKKSGLIAGTPEKIHREKQNVSEKNHYKIT